MKLIPSNFAAGYGIAAAHGLAPTSSRRGKSLVLAAVGGGLRRHYGEVEAEPLPDAMAALVARLAGGEPTGGEA